MFYNSQSLALSSGAEIWLKRMSKGLIKTYNVTVLIVTTKWSMGIGKQAVMAITEDNSNVEYFELNYFNMPFSGSPIPLSLTKLSRYICNSDVIYVLNGFVFQDLILLILAKLFFKKVILGSHAPLFTESKLHNFYVKHVSLKIAKYFDAVHVSNKIDKDVYLNNGVKKIYYIPYGIELHNDLYAKDSNKFNIFFTGRLTYQKGINKLLEVIERINRTNNHKINFFIVGDGELKLSITRITKQYPNVFYLGFLKNQQIFEQYKRAALFISTSLYETLPYACIEAMSCGVPCVAFDIKGPNEIIINGQTGFLVKPFNINQFADTIKYVYNLWNDSYEQYLNLRVNTLKRVREEYSLDLIQSCLFKMLMEVYEKGL